MRLNVTRTISGDTAILRCDGKITLGEDAPIVDGVKAALRDGLKNIVLDLTGVNYIDSSGIGSLISGFTYTRNSGGNLVLVGLTKKVSDLLEITKLITVFGVFPSVDAALVFLTGEHAAKGDDAQEI